MFATPEIAADRPAPAPSHRAAPRPADTGFAWRVLEEIDYGLMLVTAAGVLQHANHLARRELARSRFLRLDVLTVVGANEAQTEQLQQGLLAAAQGRRQMVTLREDRDSLAVACVPLAQAFEPEAAVLLMLGRRSGAPNLAVSFFARAHGLTRAEESVLKSLCDGLEVHEIAAANGVSEYTVRTQVRSLRDKTGINSMRLLVQRVASLPPVAPAGVSDVGAGPFGSF